ncbi:hypothetical protein KSP35_03825 [Aquihabitans sp. G128]|uniref:hypothetical protein n=1 Tax=Aquihabitans sp. G128 TaxID=2849779 RepID=UPI001C23BE6B|nr:hypothetical protein [Aquihabitans sp. G128]QXC61958.1 hypothetical protein KSP35_03825 [Aquihabitans sp. G128]
MTTDLERDRPDRPDPSAATSAADGPARATGEAAPDRSARSTGASSSAGSARPKGAGGANGGSGASKRTGSAGGTKAPVVGPARSYPGWLPWLLALLGLIGTVGFAIAWHEASDGSGAPPTASVEGESADMVAGSKAFSQALTNFDGATIDRDFDKIVALSTGEFRGQADEFFSSKVRKQLKEAQASSRGEVRSAYVQSFDGDRGTVFVVLDQTIANNQSPKPKADTLRMQLTMVRVQGRWKASLVDVLTAPSGGATTGDAAGSTTPLGTGAGG